jgi:hypothetical protein
VTAGFLALARYKLLLPDWRGYVLAFFAVVWIANLYMNIYARLRLDVTHERLELKSEEKKLSQRKVA